MAAALATASARPLGSATGKRKQPEAAPADSREDRVRRRELLRSAAQQAGADSGPETNLDQQGRKTEEQQQKQLQPQPPQHEQEQQEEEEQQGHREQQQQQQQQAAAQAPAPAGAELVGRPVFVFWPRAQAHFQGTVRSFDAATGWVGGPLIF